MKTNQTHKGSGGHTLLIVVFALTMMNFFVLAGMRNSDRESTTAARSRSMSRTLAAADSGLQLALSRLAQSPPDLTAFDVNLADGANVQSRARSDAVPVTLQEVGLRREREGHDMAMGSAVGFVSRIYLVRTTATSIGGSTVELQAKLTRSDVEEVGY